MPQSRTHQRRKPTAMLALFALPFVLMGCAGERPLLARYYDRHGIEVCGPLFVRWAFDDDDDPYRRDPFIGCSNHANLEHMLVNRRDLAGRNRYPLVEGNRAINPVAKVKASTPDRARAEPGSPVEAGGAAQRSVPTGEGGGGATR